MSRIGLAFRAFFGVLFSQERASRVAEAFDSPKLTSGNTPPKSGDDKSVETVRTVETRKAEPKVAKRSDALTLLELMQREARFLDLVNESLDSYSDDQIGGAARGVLRDCKKVFDRVFHLEPHCEREEGASFEVSGKIDPASVRLVGAVSGEPPFHGKVTHRGWRAAKCDLPTWNGSPESVLVLAPVEIEV